MYAPVTSCTWQVFEENRNTLTIEGTEETYNVNLGVNVPETWPGRWKDSCDRIKEKCYLRENIYIYIYT